MIFVLFFSFGVSAFSVTTLYGDSYPLKMKPGEVKETFFLLRNVVEGDSDIKVRPELTKGFEIGSLVEGAQDYKIPFGGEVEVPIKIEIPKDAEVGSQYRVNVIFKPAIDKAGQGNVQLVLNIGKSIPVVVVTDKGKLEELGSFNTITIEDEGSLIESFAPMVKGGKRVWVAIVLFLIAGILVIGILIIYFVIHSFKMQEKLEMFNAGNYQQFGNVNGGGNTI